MKQSLALALNVPVKRRRLSPHAKRVEWWRNTAATVADQHERPCQPRVRSYWATYPEPIVTALVHAGIPEPPTRTPVAIEIWFEKETR